jgi:Xaa-Pro aminopeptidase
MRFLPLLFSLFWAISVSPVHAQIPREEYRERRAALALQFGEGVVVVLGSSAPAQDYIPFYQSSAFRYLTGFLEPDAALVLEVRGGGLEEVLFVNPRDPAQETWEGIRMGPEGTRATTGIVGEPISSLAEHLRQRLRPGDRLGLVGWNGSASGVRNDVTQRIDALLTALPSDLDRVGLDGELNRLRAVKSEAEQDLLRKANTLTVEAHREVAAALAPGMNEFEIQALLEYTFRRYGAERPAFASIVGSGPNSTILHYNDNDRFMGEGEVVVVDIGGSFSGYAADITRTYPVGGRFTDAQREVYRWVRRAQAETEARARAGVSVSELSQVAAAVLSEGLAEMGLIDGPGATYDGPGGQATPQFRIFYMHGLGHGTGLDVHDPWPAILEPGVVFTLEPGLYVRPNLLDEVIPDTPTNRRWIERIRSAFDRYVGIGVRIEDGYRVRDDGELEWLSPFPRELEEIEALLSEPRRGPAERRSEWVEWSRPPR